MDARERRPALRAKLFRTRVTAAGRGRDHHAKH
jgi:hypothetical protein